MHDHSTIDSSCASESEKHDVKANVIPVNDPLDIQDIYVEGRARAWSTVIGACLIQFCAVGVLSSFGVFQEFFTTSWITNESASTISWIGSIQIFLEYVISPLGGELLDRGYFRITVITGCTLFLFCLFMLSFAAENHYYQILLSQGFGMGLGIGLLFLPTSVVSIRHFRRNQAFVMGIVDSTISFGGVVFSISLNYMLHGSIGFAWGVRIVSLVTLVFFVVGILLMTMPKPMPPSSSPSPVPSLVPIRASWTAVLKDARNDWPYILVLCQGFIMSLGTFVPPTYVQLFAETHGTSKQASFYALAVLNFSGVFGRIIPNYLGDKFGVLNVYIPCLATTGALCFAMLGAGTPQGVFPFAIFYGFFFGATNGMYLPLINSLSTGSADHLWKRCGISLIPPAIAALIGLPITGAILGPDFVWWRGILFASMTMLVATILVIAAKILLDRKNALKQGEKSLANGGQSQVIDVQHEIQKSTVLPETRP